MNQPKISPEFPFESKYVNVKGSKMHYIEQGGGGDTILFIHGNPTSSYLWRNVIPHLGGKGRCIAVDLIGMGRSDKPSIDYSFFEHAEYLEGFINALDLKNLILVLHDWGAGLGFHYAKRHEDNVKGVCFMEAVTRPIVWKDLGFIDRWVLRRFRDPKKSEKILVKKNEFVEKLLPRMVIRKLTNAEMDNYRLPFKEEYHRRVISRWPREIPVDGEPQDVDSAINENFEWLKNTPLPKLLLWSKPGAIIREPYVDHLKSVLKNMTVKCVGKGRHYIQEDTPDEIGNQLSDWYQHTLA